jgi:hypothetical protein
VRDARVWRWEETQAVPQGNDGEVPQTGSCRSRISNTEVARRGGPLAPIFSFPTNSDLEDVEPGPSEYMVPVSFAAHGRLLHDLWSFPRHERSSRVRHSLVACSRDGTQRFVCREKQPHSKRTVFSTHSHTSTTPFSGSILYVTNLYARLSLSRRNSRLHASVGTTPDMATVSRSRTRGEVENEGPKRRSF